MSHSMSHPVAFSSCTVIFTLPNIVMLYCVSIGPFEERAGGRSSHEVIVAYMCMTSEKVGIKSDRKLNDVPCATVSKNVQRFVCYSEGFQFQRTRHKTTVDTVCLRGQVYSTSICPDVCFHKLPQYQCILPQKTSLCLFQHCVCTGRVTAVVLCCLLEHGWI